MHRDVGSKMWQSGSEVLEFVYTDRGGTYVQVTQEDLLVVRGMEDYVHILHVLGYTEKIWTSTKMYISQALTPGVDLQWTIKEYGRYL